MPTAIFQKMLAERDGARQSLLALGQWAAWLRLPWRTRGGLWRCMRDVQVRFVFHLS